MSLLQRKGHGSLSRHRPPECRKRATPAPAPAPAPERSTRAGEESSKLAWPWTSHACAGWGSLAGGQNTVRRGKVELEAGQAQELRLGGGSACHTLTLSLSLSLSLYPLTRGDLQPGCNLHWDSSLSIPAQVRVRIRSFLAPILPQP